MSTTDGDQDIEDLFSSALGTLYGLTPVTLSSAGATLIYRHRKGISSIHCTGPSAHDVADSDALSVVIQTPDTDTRNWALHASSVWLSAVYLADHIADLGLDKRFQGDAGQGRIFQMLELGAGAGIPGLVCAKYLSKLLPSKGGWAITLSDYPDDMLIQTLQNNITRNGFDQDRCRAIPYAWGEEAGPLLSGSLFNSQGYDIVIAADTLWNSPSHPSLIYTLYCVLRRSEQSRVHLVAGFHTGRYTVEAFLRLLSSESQTCGAGNSINLEVEEIKERLVNSNRDREDTRPWNPDREESEEERRRWIVWIVLKWSRPYRTTLKPSV